MVVSRFDSGSPDKLTNQKQTYMNELHYTCEHDHKDGHVMTLTWPHGIQLVANFKTERCYILLDGAVKGDFPASISLKEFEGIILQCEQDDASIAKLRAKSLAQIIEECKQAIDLQSIVDDIFAYGVPEGHSSFDADIDLKDGAILSISAPFVLRTEYSVHTDPERINPDEYTLAFFEFYLEDKAEVIYRPASEYEAAINLSEDIKLDEEALEQLVKDECKK